LIDNAAHVVSVGQFRIQLDCAIKVLNCALNIAVALIGVY
jgi:hypothetical protein